MSQHPPFASPPGVRSPASFGRGPQAQCCCVAALLTAAMGHACWADSRLALLPIPHPTTIRASAALAQALTAWDREQGRLAKACALDAWSDANGWKYAISYTLLLASSRVYSVGFHLEQYCGGPYPVSLDRAAMFDMQTGQRLRLQGLSSRGPQGAVFTPQLRSRLYAAWLATLVPAQRSQGCHQLAEDDVMDGYEPGSVAVGKSGLYFMHKGAKAVEYCFGTLVLPYTRLGMGLGKMDSRKIRDLLVPEP